MSWYWRALVAALLLGGTALWVPVAATNAAGPFGSTGTTVQAPFAQDNDNSDNDDGDNDAADNNSNDNDVADDNANDNGEDNDNDVSTSTDPNVPTDPSQTGAQVSNADLTVDLWKSNERPVVNTPFQIAVTGNGAPIERIWWWADSPGGAGPAGDDLGHRGVQSLDCGGAQPCVQNWPVVARNVGWYHLHARVRDTSGREVQTDWFFLVSENPRSG
jgi:hypothetical protein